MYLYEWEKKIRDFKPSHSECSAQLCQGAHNEGFSPIDEYDLREKNTAYKSGASLCLLLEQEWSSRAPNY